MWIRYILIGFFSLTSLSIFTFQGIEIIQAFMEVFKEKKW
jgi:hypothetical protein